MVKHQRFHLHLIDAQDRLRNLIGRRGLGDDAHLLALRRHDDALQFPPGEPRHKCNIGRMIRRQAELAQPAGKTEPAVVLHGAGIVRAALGMPAPSRLAIDDDAPHAECVELQRQHHPDRPASDDNDRDRQYPCWIAHTSISVPRTKRMMPEKSFAALPWAQ